MNTIKGEQSNTLQVVTWVLLGVIVFLPMLLTSQKFEIIQLICLGVLIAIQYKVGIHRKIILGTFSFAYVVLTVFWLIGL